MVRYAGICFVIFTLTVIAHADANAQPGVTKDVGTPPPEPETRQLAALPEELAKQVNQAVPLNPERTVFLDAKAKRVLLHAEVACNDCLLEMFCCLQQTKEHESVVSVKSKAYVIHAGLLAAGGKPGKPVSFNPEFTSPTGQKVDIVVNWQDDDGKIQRCDARKWMRHTVSRYYSQNLDSSPPGVKLPLMELRYDTFNKEIIWYGEMTVPQRDKLLTLWDDKNYQAAIQRFYHDSQPKPMTAEFVFAGSYEFSREGETRKLYAGEGGQVVCVANFAEAMIDVRELSSASDGGQSYEAIAGVVPPRGTPVLVELIPIAGSETAKAKDAPPAAD